MKWSDLFWKSTEIFLQMSEQSIVSQLRGVSFSGYWSQQKDSPVAEFALGTVLSLRDLNAPLTLLAALIVLLILHWANAPGELQSVQRYSALRAAARVSVAALMLSLNHHLNDGTVTSTTAQSLQQGLARRSSRSCRAAGCSANAWAGLHHQHSKHPNSNSDISAFCHQILVSLIHL